MQYYFTSSSFCNSANYGLLQIGPADHFIPSVRKLIAKAEAPPKKKKADTPPPPKITHGQVWISQQFVGWQEVVLRALQVRP